MKKKSPTSSNEPNKSIVEKKSRLMGQPTKTPTSTMAIIRDWMDTLVIAFILAMFLRVFIVELFKIPTGSMTPTLIGGEIAEVDINRDGLNDLLLFQREDADPLYFEANQDGSYQAEGPIELTQSDFITARSRKQKRYDRIVVNKLAYWFHQPQRGDVIVFKVPASIWEVDKPLYIKRVVGLPGERISFDKYGGLKIDGINVTNPDFFNHQKYISTIRGMAPDVQLQPEISYSSQNMFTWAINEIRVPLDKLYVFGDNTNSSKDSRYWGGVPLTHLKGRAIMRYMPLNKFGFLKGGRSSHS